MTFIRHPIRWFVFAHILGFFYLCGLSACTNTQQGKAIDKANYADLGSTALALSQGATEANPVGAALIPIKLGMGYMVDKRYADNCLDRANLSRAARTIYYGATANNLMVAAGVTGGPVLGVVVGTAIYLNSDINEECIPDIEVLHQFADAYAAGDSSAIAELFTINAITPDSAGQMAIQADYAAFFATNTDRWVSWRTYDEETGTGEMWVDVDGWGNPYDVTFTYASNGKIAGMSW